jgi:class 3 adenylate cyclase
MSLNLPTGTVTFLFTDIEGSTLLWQRFPELMGRALVRHHEILHRAIDTHNGYIFQIIGDAFCSAFHTAMEALMASLDAQRLLQAEDWEVISQFCSYGVAWWVLKSIQGTISGEYISSLTLSRTARLLSAGHGGQVLLSQATVGLLPSNLSEIAELRDLGDHRLKDLQHPEHIYQLVTTDLPSSFPPLITLDNGLSGTASPNNLPLQLTRFINRDIELIEAERLLSSARLLTFIGPGGIGKTRLSIELGKEVMPAFSDGLVIELVHSEPTHYASITSILSQGWCSSVSDN